MTVIIRITKLSTKEKSWYENNIGFIAKSSKSQGLIEELNSKIENTRQRLNLLQEKLKALDSLI